MKDDPTELIKRAQEGDRRAFEALVLEYYDIIFRIACKWCGNPTDAEDITQTACLKLARSLQSFQFKSAFTSWLYRLVINAAMDWQRQNRKNYLALSDDMPGGAGNAEDALQAREVMAQVFALPDKEKTALLLVFSEGLSHAEAAKIMECRESTVSGYIHQARKKLGVKNESKERRHG